MMLYRGLFRRPGLLLCMAWGLISFNSARASRPSPSTGGAPNGTALRLALDDEQGRLDVGRMVWDGPYSGAEGPLFALRWSPGWSLRRADVDASLRLLSGQNDPGDGSLDLPGSEPGVGGQRDDPTRGFLRMRLGKDGDSVHVELGLLQNTLGHGSAVNMYQNSPEGSNLALGAAVEGQLKGGGLVLVLGDFLHPGRFIAGRLRVKPFNLILSPDSALQPNDFDLDPRTAVLGTLIVGVGAATDLEAPVTGEAIDGDGNLIAGQGARPMSTFWFDVEIPPLDLGVFHLNPYLDGVMLMGRGDGPGYGLHPGIGVGTDFFGVYWQISGQYFIGTRGYKPWYFNSRYVFERVRTVADQAPKGSTDSPAPALQGYVSSLSAQLIDTVALWAEMSDRIPLDSPDAAGYGQLRAGLTLGPAPANVTVSYLREGWQHYDRLFTDDGLTAVVVQGRVSLIAVALVARYTYGVERNIETGDRFEYSDFSVGTEFGFGL